MKQLTSKMGQRVKISEQELDKLILARIILERWRIIRGELQFIAHHHSVIETALEKQVEEVNVHMWREVEAAEAAGDHDLAHDIVEGYGSDCYDRERTYSTMHRSAMLLTLYSFTEATLAFYCRLLRMYLDMKPAEPKGGRIENFKLWLRGINVNLVSSAEYWAEIDGFRMLRNSIVHSYGDIGTNARLESYIENCPYVSFSESGFGSCHITGNGFELESTFVQHAATSIASLFEKLTDDLRPLFPASEDCIIASIEQHHLLEQQQREAERSQNGGKQTIAEILRDII